MRSAQVHNRRSAFVQLRKFRKCQKTRMQPQKDHLFVVCEEKTWEEVEFRLCLPEILLAKPSSDGRISVN